jgi:hypothetical protein
MPPTPRAELWEHVDALADRAPGLNALAFHGLQLVAARRLRRRGLPVPAALRIEQQLSAIRGLCVPELLQRVRDALDGDVLLVKGPEAAARWEQPDVRSFWDLDLLVADSHAAQRALLAAGFHEIGDPDLYRDIHHLRPLQWGDRPLTIELHHRPKWPAHLSAPPMAALMAGAVPSATGVAGIGAPDPAAHVLLLAAHAWAHAPLGSVRHLVDVVAVKMETEPGAVAALADRWGCTRLWRTTTLAADAVLLGGPPTPATRTWARSLAQARECTVLERHLRDLAGPLWALPPAAAGAALAERGRSLLRPVDDEGWAAKLRRSRRALSHALLAKSAHDATARRPPIRTEQESS